MNTARSVGLAAGLIVGLAIAGPTWARDCSPSSTAASEKAIANFASAAVDDYKLGDHLTASLRDRANNYMTARYLQHQPGVPSGREAFVQFHIKWYKDHPPQPPQPSAGSHPDTIVAHCDMVLYMHYIPRPDPDHPGKAYESYLFDFWRVRDGKADEHWDSFQDLWRQATAGDSSPEGPTATTAAADASGGFDESGPETCSAAKIADNTRLLARLERAMGNRSALAKDAQSLIAADYVEHDPLLTGPQHRGRAGFLHAVETTPQTLPGADFRYGAPEIAYADCNHIVTIKTIKRRDTADPKTVYDAFWFDVWRVRDGRLAAHWDESLRNADYHWNDVDSLNRHD